VIRASISRTGPTSERRWKIDEEVELVRADGSRFWGHRQGAPVRAGHISAGTIWIVADITESRLQREQLSWKAAHDPLTDLLNRREFEALLAEQ